MTRIMHSTRSARAPLRRGECAGKTIRTARITKASEPATVRREERFRRPAHGRHEHADLLIVLDRHSPIEQRRAYFDDPAPTGLR